TPEKHKEYYFADGDIVIRIQNTLFNVHLSVLHEHSEVFRETIAPPMFNGKALKLGFNDDCPFVLREESAVDFERLLGIFYPSKSPFCKAADVDDWLSILRLGQKYDIHDVIPLAAQHLNSLTIDSFRKIMIWKEFRLNPVFLASAYIKLCQRVKPLTLDMTRMLGIDTFTKVAASRD
ncbi:hypothetical protein C8J56DRAFT_759944, partial [Mycena floridula]